MGKEALELRQCLIDDLNLIRGMYGKYRMSPELKDYYDNEWYPQQRKLEEEVDVSMRGYYGRRHTHAYKVAMLLAAAKGDSYVLDIRTFLEAIEILRENEKFLTDLYNIMMLGPDSAAMDYVLKAIPLEPKWITRSDLLRKVWRKVDNSAAKLDRYLNYLDQADCIVTKVVGKAAAYSRRRDRN